MCARETENESVKNLRLTRFFFLIYVFFFFLLLYEVTSLGRAGIVGSKFLLARRSKKNFKKWKYIADVFCASPCTIPLRHRAFEPCALGCRSEQSGGEAAAARRSYLHKESVTVWRKEKLHSFFHAPPTAASGIEVCAVRGKKKRERKQRAARSRV